MNVKKIINFIVPLRIFSSRNLSSLGLVFLFFLIYILCGGKIEIQPLTAVKNVSSQNFGYFEPVEEVVREEVKQVEKIILPEKKQEKQEEQVDFERLSNRLRRK
ncbi:MAG: hypothetical protein LBE20_06815 [Deltaproteobacteria bacterium]|jgi:hypothetical protein|nr:hypothetical protein [Deltaproteobacteria bacterium]